MNRRNFFGKIGQAAAGAALVPVAAVVPVTPEPIILQLAMDDAELARRMMAIMHRDVQGIRRTIRRVASQEPADRILGLPEGPDQEGEKP